VRAPKVRYRLPIRPLIPTLVLLAPIGCATDWESHGSVPRTSQTLLSVRSEPSAEVRVDGVIIGRTPLQVPLTYQGRMERFERRVSYWRTQPGWSVFLTITSLGLYLPFSLIPVDDEERLGPVTAFEANRFLVSVEASGYQPFERALELRGEERLEVNAELAPVDHASIQEDLP
jgi:hypothetical protein